MVLWCCCAAVVLWCCGAVVLWCCGATHRLPHHVFIDQQCCNTHTLPLFTSSQFTLSLSLYSNSSPLLHPSNSPSHCLNTFTDVHTLVSVASFIMLAFPRYGGFEQTHGNNAGLASELYRTGVMHCPGTYNPNTNP